MELERKRGIGNNIPIFAPVEITFGTTVPWMTIVAIKNEVISDANLHVIIVNVVWQLEIGSKSNSPALLMEKNENKLSINKEQVFS